MYVSCMENISLKRLALIKDKRLYEKMRSIVCIVSVEMQSAILSEASCNPL